MSNRVFVEAGELAVGERFYRVNGPDVHSETKEAWVVTRKIRNHVLFKPEHGIIDLAIEKYIVVERPES